MANIGKSTKKETGLVFAGVGGAGGWGSSRGPANGYVILFSFKCIMKQMNLTVY